MLYHQRNEKIFQKALRKGRIEKEPLYRESSLVNFIQEIDSMSFRKPIKR